MTKMGYACKSVREVSSVRCVWHRYDIPNEVSVLPICDPFTSLNNSFKNKAKRKLNNEIYLILKIESQLQFKGK